MSAAHLTVANIAKLLGGDVRGDQVLAPGPGHSEHDRSLSIKSDKDAPEGFVVHSFAGDDPIACREYVRQKLGLPDSNEKKRKGVGNWMFISEHIYRTAEAQPYLRVRKMRDENGKKQYPQSHWDGHQWIKGAPKTPKLPYRLPELVAAPLTGAVNFCEGEKDCDNLAKVGFIATTQSGGASAPWDHALTEYFKDRHVVVLPDADNVGRRHGQKVAKALNGVAASVRVLELYPDRDDGSDVSDWLAADTAGVKLPMLAKDAPLWEPPADGDEDEGSVGDHDDLIAELAALAPVRYDRERKAAADLLGVRASILDRLVREQRAKLRVKGDEAGGLQGGVVSFPEPDAWHEPVNGAALLDDIAAAIRRHVVMTDHARDACALWTVHTYALDQFFITPRLCVRSPVKGCGKTTLLDILGGLVLHALSTANVSVAALFRVVEAHRPTLLVDEADTFLATADELRGVLNSGHRKGGAVLRTVGDDHEPRSFSTFSACAIALIGALPGTLHDRSVVIDLKRRLPTETAAAFRPDRAGPLDELARKAARWAADNAVALGSSDPVMPDGIINRAADNWRALLAIADLAGGDWPDRARKAATARHDGDEDEASRLELALGDLRDIFGDAEEKSSAELVKALAEMEGRPWGEYGKTGKPISQNALARLLKRVSVAPQQIGPEGARLRGYVRAHFQDAFARYLAIEGDHNRPSVQNPAKPGISEISQPSSREGSWTDGKCQKTNNDGLLDGWTVGMGKAPVCAQCGTAGSHTNRLKAWPLRGTTVVLHECCEHAFVDRHRD